MDKYIYDERNGLWYELQGEITIFLVLPYQTKKKDLSAFGDGDTNAI